MKKKECRICHKEFVPRNSVQCLCSFECANTNKKLKDAEYRKKQFEKYWFKKTTIYQHKCCECNKEFECLSKTQKTCSRKCFFNMEKERRKWEKNPAYRNGMYSYKSKEPKKLRSMTEWFGQKEFLRNAKKMKDDQILEVGHSFCERCATSISLRRETHHIIYRSEAPYHVNLHNLRNLVRHCIKCHNKFHSNKQLRDRLVVERRLWELFPEYIKQESYEKMVLQ